MRNILLAVALSAVAAPAVVSAQGFDTQQFNLGPSLSTNHFNVSSARILDHTQYEFGLMLDYASSPLVFDPRLEEELVEIVDGQLTLGLNGAIGLFDRLEIGFSVPLILDQTGDEYAPLGDAAAPDPGFGVGDVRIVPEVLFFNQDTDEDPGGAALSLALHLWLPTGSEEVYQGDGGIRLEPRVAFDYVLPRDVTVSANVGYLLRQEAVLANLEVDDTFTWGLGLDVPFSDFHAIAELTGDVSTAASGSAAEETPLATNLGGRYFFANGIMAQAGLGVGMNQGFGTPRWRFFAGLSYARTPDADPDDDGILRDDDACPLEAEDFDGFEDTDGCPERDNDQDGVNDEDDGCPMDAEDVDGFEDDDGCVDTDNDSDRILDEDDACPDEPEDIDGFEEMDGCPDPDNDGDGVLDVDDFCPLDAEDVDGFEDSDGCPDEDNDRDGRLDAVDACPDEAEDFDGLEDEDGCPEEGAGAVQLTCDAIEITERVYFDTDSDTIQARSFNLLDQIAGVMRGAQFIRSMRVEGHTDDRGDAEYNRDLSDRRAQAVLRYLVEAGVESRRLQAMGFGEEQPVADNETRDGQNQNRRVDFVVVDQDTQCE
ncbi:MAG: outer membrane protein OmpA-like peptidoglycan-associated protein [Bradymonadia bacterium]|jgi:outer membrane protein OmpA-like peptidoglycan-associated protein